jgi:hypothetical protein
MVQTSVEKSKEEADAFLQEASKAVSKGLGKCTLSVNKLKASSITREGACLTAGKPESYVMVSHRTATMRCVKLSETAC